MSRPVGYNQGDPNVLTTCRGRYEFTMVVGATCNSPYAVPTCVNTVQFEIDKGSHNDMTTYRKVIP